MNKEELLTGGIVGLVAGLLIGSFAYLIIPICAVLWALGGGEDKAWRRIGVPVSIVAMSLFLHENLWSILSIPAGFGVLSIGYGIPTSDPLDAGSVLGRFFYKLTPKYASLLTRGTLHLLLFVALIPTWLHL